MTSLAAQFLNSSLAQEISKEEQEIERQKEFFADRKRRSDYAAKIEVYASRKLNRNSEERRRRKEERREMQKNIDAMDLRLPGSFGG